MTPEKIRETLLRAESHEDAAAIAELSGMQAAGARYASTVQDPVHGHGSHDILVHVLTAGDIA